VLLGVALPLMVGVVLVGVLPPPVGVPPTFAFDPVGTGAVGSVMPLFNPVIVDNKV
jgi:hypothetical protein